MSQKQYRIIGAGWNNEQRGSIDLKLDNGMRITLFQNDRKAPGSSQPDWRASALAETAKNVGIEEGEYSRATPSSTPVSSTSEEEIDLDSLPF